MEFLAASRALQIPNRTSPRREAIHTNASFFCLAKISPEDASFQGRSAWRARRGASSLPWSLNAAMVTPKKNKNNRIARKVRSFDVVVAAAAVKVVGAADVLVETEPLMKLSEGQRQLFHQLPSGLRMEVICEKGAVAEGGGTGEQGHSSKAPLVFVHGSYHAAWCWACRWMPYFAARGYDCYAISLLGQGASDVPAEKTPLSLETHARDLANFIRLNLTAPPVLIGHSFGGLIVQWFFSRTASTASAASSTLTEGDEVFPSVAAGALVCSNPPTGNGPMVMRFLKRDIIGSIQITLSLAAKLFGSSLYLCRKSFFSPDMPDAEVQKYQKLLKQSSRYRMIDLRLLNDSLPLPRPPPQAPPVLVLAAENDFIVDREGSQETAEWYGTEPLIISGSGHDIMLDSAWEKAAEALQSWFDRHAL